MLLRARALLAEHLKRVPIPAAIRVAGPDRHALAWAAALAVTLAAAPAGAAPFAYVVGANHATELVDVATHADTFAGATVFATDSLATAPSGPVGLTPMGLAAGAGHRTVGPSRPGSS